MNSHPSYQASLEILAQGLKSSASIAEFEQLYVLALPSILPVAIMENEPSLAKEGIRAGVIEFYYAHGMSASVFFSKEGQLRVFHKVRNITQSLYVALLSNWLLENQAQFSQAIKRRYFEDKDIELIAQQVDRVIDFENELWRRDVMRYAIKRSFGFDVRDAIFLLENSMKVKNFDYKFVQLNNEIRHLSKHAELPPLELEEEEVIIQALEGVDLAKVLGEVIEEVLHLYLPLDKTDNLDFSRRFGFLVRQRLRHAMESLWKVPLSESLKSLFCEHLIRDNLEAIYQRVASELLSRFKNNEESAQKFISFYDGHVTFLGGTRRMKKPVIKDEKKRVHHVQTIQRLLQNHHAISTEIEELKGRIDKLQKQQEGLDEEIDSLVGKLTPYKLDQQEVERELSRIAKEIQKLKQGNRPSSEMLKNLADAEGEWLAKSHDIQQVMREAERALEEKQGEKRKIPEMIRSLQQQIANKIKVSKSVLDEYVMVERALGRAIEAFKVDD